MEFGQKLGRGLERARTGLDQFLHDESGSKRWTPDTVRSDLAWAVLAASWVALGGALAVEDNSLKFSLASTALTLQCGGMIFLVRIRNH